MLSYTLSSELRKAMAADEPAVKAALCAIANARFGGTDRLEGIYKYEGGIRVNNREIAIKNYTVMDDWRRTLDATPEEAATVEAIAEVARILETEGAAVLRQRYGSCEMGDPLRCLIGAAP